MMKKLAAAALLGSDKALGAVGGSLAIASLGFGVYMTTYGPPAGSLGHSKDFTVFAQLAPHHRQGTAPKAPPPPAAAPKAAPVEDLDMTATASIPKAEAGPRPVAAFRPDPARLADEAKDFYPDAATIIASVTLEAAQADNATIAVGGRPRTVRIGDKVPGAGEVLEIRLGRYPSLKTSRGYIVAARQD